MTSKKAFCHQNYTWYNCTANTMLDRIATIAQTTDRGLNLLPLNQPTTMNTSASGGNTLNRNGIADISSFLFFVMVFKSR